MSSDDADVSLLVRALSGQVARCTEPLDAQAAGNALYGLQGTLTTVDGQGLGLQLLRSFIKLHEEALAADYTPEHIFCGRSVVMTLPFLRDHVTEGEVKECLIILTDIESKTRVSDFDEEGDPADTRGLFYSDERMICMHLSITEASGESYISRTHKEHLFGLFKCDVVV